MVTPPVDLPLSGLVRYLLHVAHVHLIRSEISRADPEGESLARGFHTRIHDSLRTHTRHLGGSTTSRDIISFVLIMRSLSYQQSKQFKANSSSTGRSFFAEAFVTFPTRQFLTKAQSSLVRASSQTDTRLMAQTNCECFGLCRARGFLDANEINLHSLDYASDEK